VSLARLRRVAEQLRPVAHEAAGLEARWLIEEAGIDAARLEAMILRRLGGEPVDRIIGRRGFWTLDLMVGPATLSPRCDTETVVRAARDRIVVERGKGTSLRILDLGTGTGAILLALLAELPNATGLGIDISEEALAVARGNADQNGLTRRAAFQRGDWAEGIAEPFDLIVSNPPYIPTQEILSLDREVRDHDPRLALDGGDDGLACYRLLLPQIAARLADSGFAVLEFGRGQGPDIAQLALAADLVPMGFCNDLNQIERAIILNKI
jgi:release factor glutamine methyltransferase